MLTCGIIGLPLAGKTTLFNLLTNASAETSKFQTGRTQANVGIAQVPDGRIDWLSAMYSPKKTTYAQIEFTDIVGHTPGSDSGKGANPFLSAVRDCDALVQVVRAFENTDVEHPMGGIDVVRDFNDVWAELFFSDLDLVEKRLVKLEATKKRTKEMDREQEALVRCRAALEAEKPLGEVDLDADERQLLKSYAFLTEKPMLVVVNVDEEQLKSSDYAGKEALASVLADKGIPSLVVCAQAEAEISQLDEEDRALFMEELGITEAGIAKIAKVTYDRLGLLSFFTVGEDEVKAWTIAAGTQAKQAAGKIHSDIERGFIRAEVVAYDVLHELKTVAKAREKGQYRLEGRDYVVKDGDIINFRFNA